MWVHFLYEYPHSGQLWISQKIIILSNNFRQIGVGHQSISLIWTARAFGAFFACTISGQAFGSSWISTTKRKLSYFGSAHLIISTCLFLVPFVKDLPQTLVTFGFMTLATASYDVSDNGFVHELLGTKHSRPIIQSLHACASIGFLSCKFQVKKYIFYCGKQAISIFYWVFNLCVMYKSKS